MPDDRFNGGVAAAVTITKAATSSSSSSSGGAMKKGPWTAAEDAILMEYVRKHGEGNWNAVQRNSGLKRCGKSCRLRWANHLRPNLRKGPFSPEEERLILELHSKLGNKWARMAAQLPGRTDNEIKNYWNTRIKRRQRAGLPLYPFDIHRPSPSNPHHRLSSAPLSLFDFTAAPLSLSSNSTQSQSFTAPQQKDLAGIFNPAAPQQLQNTVFFFNSPSLQHDGQRFCVKTELPSSQFFSPSSDLCSSGRNESLLLDSLLLESGNVGGDHRRGLSFLPEPTHENLAFVNGNACEISSKLPSNELGKREDGEEYRPVEDDLSALLELIPMTAARGLYDDGGGGSGSDGGREMSNGQSSGLTEDNMGMQVLPASTREDEGRSIGSLPWMG